MGVAGMLCACVLAASPGEAGQAGEPNGAALPPRRDLFGTSERKAGKRPGSPRRVWGTVELSDDTKVEGWLSLAPGKPLEVFDLEAKEWREFTIDEILGLRATPRKEELEREWRWKEYGKDEKVYTGRAYPKRWLDHELVLGPEGRDGQGSRRRGPEGRDGQRSGRRGPEGRDGQGSGRRGPEGRDGQGSGRRGPEGRDGQRSGRRGAEDEGDEEDGKPGERIRCHVRGAAIYVTTEPDESGTDEAEGGDGEAGREKPGDDERSDGERKPAPRPEPPRKLRFIIRQYERGKLGQALDDLVYVKQVLQHEKGRRPRPADAKDAARTARGKRRPRAR